MNIDAVAIALISGLSGIIGTGMFIRAKVKENEEGLKKHTSEDLAFHATVLDRLARVETKIDILLRRKSDVD